MGEVRDVNECDPDTLGSTKGALSTSWPKKSVLAVMNVNLDKKNLKIQRDVIHEIQQCESGPEILNIQRGFISDVW